MSEVLDSCWTSACQESDQSRRHLQDDYRIAVQHPDPSLLPKKRLTQAEPFTVSDVDFTRALYIREAVAEIEITSTSLYLPACRRLLFPLLHAVHGRLRNAVAYRVQRPASRVFYFA